MKKLVGKKFRKDSFEVNSFYDPLRLRFLKNFEELRPDLTEFDTLDALSGHINKHAMLNGRPSNDARRIRDRYIEELSKIIEHFGARSVIEVGSGYGRNLLALKSRHPTLEARGLELSDTSVELSKTAAKFYGLNCQFDQI